MKKKEIDDRFALDWLVCEDRPFLFYGAKEKDKEYKETLSILFLFLVHWKFKLLWILSPSFLIGRINFRLYISPFRGFSIS